MIIYFILLIMSTLDLTKYTFIDAPENDEVMELIINGLIQADNAQTQNGKWIVFTSNLRKVTEEYEKLSAKEKEDRENHIAKEYTNLTNIQYISDIGIESTLRYSHEKNFINTSRHYKSRKTVQSMINHYILLSENEKKELAKDMNDKKRNNNNVLPKFLGRILQALNYAYPTKEVNGTIQKSDRIMLRQVSGLLVLTRNTLNYIKNYGK